MIDNAKKILLFILMVVNLPGCVGYYYSKPSDPVEKDLSQAIKIVPIKERQLWKREEPKFYNDDRASFLNKEDQKILIENEVKIYNDKTRWCGLTIWALVFPVPLWLPVCRTYTELTFKNGEPVSSREQHVDGAGFICGPFIPLMGISKSPLPDGFCGEMNSEQLFTEDTLSDRRGRAARRR